MSSVIEMPESHTGRMESLEQRAVVIETGPSAWFDEPTPRAIPGDHVIVTKFAGFMVHPTDSADGQSYRLVNDRDIFCGIEVRDV